MVDLDNDPFAALRLAAAAAEIPGADAVRRRGEQRTRTTRLLAVTAVLVVAAGSGLALTAADGGTQTLRPPVAVVPTADAPSPQPPAPVAPTSPPASASTPAVGAAVPSRRASSSASAAAAARASARAEAAAARAASTPRLSVTLLRTSAAGAAHVTYSARVQGLVPQRWTVEPDTGPSVPDPGDELIGTTVSWGDSSLDGGSDGGAATCHAGAALVPIDETFTEFHDFEAGTFTTRLSADACGVTATGTVTVTG